jgi:aminoglycoside phosphotransferase (APT) family kinase protein
VRRRQQYAEVPEPVRLAIENELGAPVVDVLSHTGGFSPGVAATLTLANGDRAFLKAASPDPNPDTPGIHRQEAEIAAALPRDAPVPAFRFAYDDGEWIALAFDHVDGASPVEPWEPDELTRVLVAVHDLARALTPSPVAIRDARDALAPLFNGWNSFAAVDGAALEPAWRDRLPELVALERWAIPASAGDTLLHLDLRGDNVLLTDQRVYFIDWPWAAVGAAWVDLALMLPSIAMQGGPAPEEIWDVHPLAHSADGGAVDAIVCGLAGFFTWQSQLPPAPGIPTLREFQAAQGVFARAWLARRRGWSETVRGTR